MSEVDQEQRPWRAKRVFTLQCDKAVSGDIVRAVSGHFVTLYRGSDN